MEKKWIVLLFICMHSTGTLYAQWTKKDSLWLEDVLSGKQKIQLNPETKKAIESGTFINTDGLQPELLSAPPLLPISKDFDLSVSPDSSNTDMPFHQSIPPAVYLIYAHKNTLRTDSADVSESPAFAMPDLRDKNRIQIKNTPVSVAAQATNIYNTNVKDGQQRGGFVGGVIVTFSMNDLLMGIFNKTERNKRRNKKRAQAWKTYTEYP